MNDVTAVALSLGEPYAERALASLDRQTCAPMPVVRIVGVRPFSRAMNEAAAQVGTAFFLQLDADMIPNAWCVEELRAAMEDGIGMAAGALWDPLMGTEAGIKLFRTDAVRQLRFRDTVAPDVDFYQRLPEHGWRTAFRLPSPVRSAHETPWPTFGRHQPDYTPTSAYRRLHVLGARYRGRADGVGFQWRYGRLLRSSHPLAVLARIALVAGLFRSPDDSASHDEAAWLHGFLNQAPNRVAPASAMLVAPASALVAPASVLVAPASVPGGARSAPDCELFTRWHEAGAHSRATMDRTAFLHQLDHADSSAHWLPRLALCHGLSFAHCATGQLQASIEAARELFGK